jgi:hypothetical protein
MKPFELELSYDDLIQERKDNQPFALEYMRLALEVSKHNLEVAYYNRPIERQQAGVPNEVVHSAEDAEAPEYPENTLKVFNAGYSVLTVDDGCYVIKNRRENGLWTPATHIFSEAVRIIKEMPEDPNYALAFMTRPSGTL